MVEKPRACCEELKISHSKCEKLEMWRDVRIIEDMKSLVLIVTERLDGGVSMFSGMCNASYLSSPFFFFW